MMLVTVQMYGQNLRHDDHTEDDVGTEMMDSRTAAALCMDIVEMITFLPSSCPQSSYLPNYFTGRSRVPAKK
jgi:hypothetical protein